MDGQFITNKDLILSDIINSILPKCDNAYFLVGYFYFPIIYFNALILILSVYILFQ